MILQQTFCDLFSEKQCNTLEVARGFLRFSLRSKKRLDFDMNSKNHSSIGISVLNMLKGILKLMSFNPTSPPQQVSRQKFKTMKNIQMWAWCIHSPIINLHNGWCFIYSRLQWITKLWQLLMNQQHIWSHSDGRDGGMVRQWVIPDSIPQLDVYLFSVFQTSFWHTHLWEML